MKGMIGKKVGMTQIFDEQGNRCAGCGTSSLADEIRTVHSYPFELRPQNLAGTL